MADIDEVGIDGGDNAPSVERDSEEQETSVGFNADDVHS
jgi:hypothetical protein